MAGCGSLQRQNLEHLSPWLLAALRDWLSLTLGDFVFAFYPSSAVLLLAMARSIICRCFMRALNFLDRLDSAGWSGIERIMRFEQVITRCLIKFGKGMRRTPLRTFLIRVPSITDHPQVRWFKSSTQDEMQSTIHASRCATRQGPFEVTG